jgi:deazaflavin-dependent oxidoreductase (nitroreductase family)
VTPSDPGYTTPDLALYGEEHIRRYRETGGEVGHEWNGVPTLILTTVGRKSGLKRSSAMIYGRSGDAYVVIASQGGAPTHPAWYLNLDVNPGVEVEVRDERFDARARVADGEERERLWKLMAEVWPNFDVYQTRTERQIPVVVLERA